MYVLKSTSIGGTRGDVHSTRWLNTGFMPVAIASEYALSRCVCLPYTRFITENTRSVEFSVDSFQNHWIDRVRNASCQNQ